MSSYEDILAAANLTDDDDSVQRIKEVAARALSSADKDARLLFTEHFNHTYIPDFVMKWENRPDRFVFLRASAYAEEIEEDVMTLADRHPMFVQLSRFQPYGDTPNRPAIESLGRSAGATKSLVTSIPAIGHLGGSESPRTGRMLSSFVMRGGRGLVEDAEAKVISESVEAGFVGAMESDRALTAAAIDAVEGVLDPQSAVEFTHLFEAAWISGGASPVDFPGGVTSIGKDITEEMLRQLLDIVPGTATDFWERVGRSITSDSFGRLHLVGDQPHLQHIMKNAITRLAGSRCSIRKTRRSDQETDPFTWQVSNGSLSLRGGGYQAWIGPATPDETEEDLTLEPPPTLSKLATRSENADLTIFDVSVRGVDEISVRFTSPSDRDVATSDLVERVTESLGTSVQVDEVVARVDGKAARIQHSKGLATTRTNAKVSISGLVWNAWNILTESEEAVRGELAEMLRHGEDANPEGSSAREGSESESDETQDVGITAVDGEKQDGGSEE